MGDSVVQDLRQHHSVGVVDDGEAILCQQRNVEQRVVKDLEYGRVF